MNIEGGLKMEFERYFQVWDKLTREKQEEISGAAFARNVKKGTVLHGRGEDCTGLILVESGQLRAFILSDEGREVTIYRLFEMDICLLSAPCMIQSLHFEVTLEAEKDAKIWVIPSGIYKDLMEESAVVANYTNQIMASRFSEVMWLMEQIMWKSFDKRLAGFLLEETSLEGEPCIRITHEKIANHMGTAREVVTRMLRYFQNEGLVKLSRGAIEVTDEEGLEKLCM